MLFLPVFAVALFWDWNAWRERQCEHGEVSLLVLNIFTKIRLFKKDADNYSLFIFDKYKYFLPARMMIRSLATYLRWNAFGMSVNLSVFFYLMILILKASKCLFVRDKKALHWRGTMFDVEEKSFLFQLWQLMSEVIYK